ncbi:phosphatase PAP2 family protein [Caulobacter sp. KR2-114]|uniref:phosphatase PAP2 family protein n=1 Tax=Caulobacter sp. KR2-114 TaxID=3400912 RepID=UPI003C082CF3
MAAELAPAVAGATPDLRGALRLNAVLVGVMLAYVAITFLVARSGGVPFSLGLYAVLWLVFGGLGAAAFALRRRLPARWRIGERVVLAAPVLLVAPAFFSAFTSLKSGLAQLHPYTWDAAIAGWDRAIFGQDAWRVLQPALGHPPITFALSVLYSGWHAAMLTIFGGLCFSLGRPALRLQALLALVACWALLGTWGAVALASVGPCFVGPLHLPGPDGFAEQAAYLRTANAQLPIWEFAEQSRLLNAAAAGRPVLGSGISAMPSMHIAVAFLMMLVGWRFGRRAGVAGSLYFLVIVVGSIHLGWHYFMDGVVAAAGAGLLWLAAGPVARWTVAAAA